MLKTGDYFEYFDSIYCVVSASESSASIVPVKEVGDHHILGSTNISRGASVRILDDDEKDKYVRKDKDGKPISRKKKGTIKKNKKATKREQELKDMINLQARKKAKRKSRGADLEEARELNEEIEEVKKKKTRTAKRKTTTKKNKKK